MAKPLMHLWQLWGYNPGDKAPVAGGAQHSALHEDTPTGRAGSAPCPRPVQGVGPQEGLCFWSLIPEE